MVRIHAVTAALVIAAAALTAPVTSFLQANSTANRVLTIARDLPSLKIHVHTKRDTLQVFRRSDFEIIATPTVASDANGQDRVYYDGFANFVNGDTTHSYYLVDGTAYYTTKSNVPGDSRESVVCLAPQEMPPVQQLLEAFNAAVPTTMAASSQSPSCPRGYLWYASFVGQQYTICTQRSSAAGFTISSEAFVIDFIYLPVRVDITAPILTTSDLKGCASSSQAMTLTAATLDLLSGEASPNWSGDVPQQESSTFGGCSCKGAKRPCLFVHGLGLTGDDPLDDEINYFGSYVRNHAPCCTTIQYASLNTVDNAWHSDVLRASLCKKAMAMSSEKTGNTIKDTIIVTHSMGNLILGSAIANGNCKLDPSSTWVGTSGPMAGSMASDYLQNTCAGNSLLKEVADIFGQCPANKATVNLAYQGQSYAQIGSALSANYAAAQKAYTANVKAVMCSDDNDGLSATGYQLAYWAVGKAIKHITKFHDGIVEFDSCRAGINATEFKPSYKSRYYVTQLNHIDTTFRNGDGWFSDAKKPVKWFECLL